MRRTDHLTLDEETGAVTVRILIPEGSRVDGMDHAATVQAYLRKNFPGHDDDPFSWHIVHANPSNPEIQITAFPKTDVDNRWWR